MNNSITLVGRVVQNPVQKSISEKNTVLAEFSLAVKDYAKKGLEQDANFFDIKAFNGQVDRVMAYIKRGREVVITGRVAVESYNRKNGDHVLKYVVIMNGFHLCGNKQDLVEVAPEPQTEAAVSNEKKSKKTAA